MNAKAQRMDFRIEEEQKLLIEEAASLSGETITSFAISTLVQRAKDVIQSHNSTMLSLNDSQRFLKILDQAAEPNAKLKRAFEKYRQHGK